MYRKDNPNQLKFKNFYLSFGGELSGENRWVILAEQIPWQQIEQDYSELFSNDEGCPAKAARVGFGALIIKERLGTSDRETVEQIRENRRYCQGKGIRFSGPPLGRPKNVTEANASELKEARRIHRQDELDRIAVEGKFGQGKRRFTLARIMAKLAKTSEAVITISFLVMNLEKILSALLCFLFCFYRWCCISLRESPAVHRNQDWCVPIAAFHQLSSRLEA